VVVLTGILVSAALAVSAALSSAGVSSAQPGGDLLTTAGCARGAPDSPPHARSRDRAPDPADPGDEAGAPPATERRELRGYALREITDPIPLHSSINLQPTYEQSKGGDSKGFVKLKAVLVIEAGLPLLSRIEWPVPEVASESGTTTVGVSDLTWLNLFLVGGTSKWGKVGLGPVFVFPTAAHQEMGQGKYQVGPALGYVNDAVPGWQFALLVQQFFSFAGDPSRQTVNQVQIQPFITKYLSESWYLASEPIITVNFEQRTSSVPLNFIIGKVVDRRWNFNAQLTVYPRWTSPPTKNFEIILNVGYHFPALFSRR
jgi:hypothetical protein